MKHHQSALLFLDFSESGNFPKYFIFKDKYTETDFQHFSCLNWKEIYLNDLTGFFYKLSYWSLLTSEYS